MWSALVDHWTGSGLEVIHAGETDSGEAGPFAAALRTLRRHRGFRRGVVVADSSEAGRQGLLLRLLGTRPEVRILVVVHHLNDAFRYRHPLYVGFARANETGVLRLADRVVVHTLQEKERIEARGVDPRRIAVVPLGIRPAPPGPPPRDLGAEDPLRLLWIGGDFPRKGLDTLLEAISLSPAPAPLLTVVGRPQRAELLEAARARVAALGLGSRVRFLGQLEAEALDRLWPEHDVYVLPSRHEGHGLAVDEALVRGVPVLLTEIPAFLERIPRDAAAWVPVGDVSALAGAFGALRPVEARASLADRGRELASGFAGWETTLARYEAVLREEIARCPR